MKFHNRYKGIYSSIFLIALTGTAFAAQAGTRWTAIGPPGKFYIGAFGGGGAPNQFDISQFGTAFYFEVAGGPLAVNAFGHTNDNPSVWLAGAQVGYQAPEILINPGLQWRLVPAAELEGYYIGNRTFTGNLSNNTTRLPEHDFFVSYAMESSVFLVNAVIGLNIPCFTFQPYVGVGIGGAVVKITGADATQIAPAEPGVNHYNSRTDDTAPTFAGQVKAGLSYDINNCVNVFAEYRWLYLSNTHFAFGSTVYPAHPATSYWQVDLGHQNYNLGTVGIRFTF